MRECTSAGRVFNQYAHLRQLPHVLEKVTDGCVLCLRERLSCVVRRGCIVGVGASGQRSRCLNPFGKPRISAVRELQELFRDRDVKNLIQQYLRVSE